MTPGTRVPTIPQPAHTGPAEQAPMLDADASLIDNWEAAFAEKFSGMDRETIKATFLQSAEDSDLEHFCDALGVDHSKYKPDTKTRVMKNAILSKIFKKGTDEIKL